jgi:hypothetical protein
MHDMTISQGTVLYIFIHVDRAKGHWEMANLIILLQGIEPNL